MYLHIAGIDSGDSHDDKHPGDKGWIEVNSFSHEIKQPSGGSSSAQGSHTGGRADHGDFKISKRMDLASPKLAIFVASGHKVPKIVLELWRQGGENKREKYIEYIFKDSIIALLTQNGVSSSDEPTPTEDISIRYGEIDWVFKNTDIVAGGSTQTASSGWSTRTNKPVDPGITDLADDTEKSLT
jgi:type VI secretion system secreted protein Hcp